METHNLAELEVAHRLGAQIIGVNNRNLTTFEVDLQTSVDLAKYFKDDCLYISESAIFTGQDAERVAPYFKRNFSWDSSHAGRGCGSKNQGVAD